MQGYDLAVVGAGIVGLAHALAGARRGLRVVVIDRDARANGASVRNFGLVVVSGQRAGESRRLAERSRAVWLELAAEAGIAVVHRGMLVAAQRAEALGVLEAFAGGEHGAECRMLGAAEAAALQPGLDAAALKGALLSPHEIRVDSRAALPRLAGFLAERRGVAFLRGVAARGVAHPVVETGAGAVRAERIVVCPGDDLVTLYPDIVREHEVTRCKLQMLRAADPGFRLGAALISDLSLVRYEGFADLPEAEALRRVLGEERGAALAAGVHLIAAQDADGSLVLGDSHHYAETPDPFGSEEVDRLILEEYRALFGAIPAVSARWTGTYASSARQPRFRAAPEAGVRLVMVTSGTGASTAFAIGEDTVAELFGG
jgi:FAD dependent oxidoreductase TIGR03364